MYGKYSNQRKVRARVEQPRYSLRAREPDNNDLTGPVTSSPEKTQLVVEGRLYAKSATLFTNKQGRVVVDSRLMIVPKGISEERLRSQMAQLDADKDVYFHNFGEKEDKTQPMSVTMTTSNNVIFFRRVAEISLDDEGDDYCSTRTEDFCPVKFGPDTGILNLDDIIHVKRSPTSISWREKLIISFGAESSSGHGELKPMIGRPAESEEPHYIHESATLAGKTLIVDREIYLEKKSWNREADFIEKYIKGYTIRPSFVAAPAPTRPRPPPRPPVRGQRLLRFNAARLKKEAPKPIQRQEGGPPSVLETMPQEFLPIECPIDSHAAHELAIKNVGQKSAAWTVKSRPEGLFKAEPKSGIIKPGITAKVTLKFGDESDVLSQTDSVEVVWADVDKETAADDTQKIALPVVYLN